jgi:hypothetical protein
MLAIISQHDACSTPGRHILPRCSTPGESFARLGLWIRIWVGLIPEGRPEGSISAKRLRLTWRRSLCRVVRLLGLDAATRLDSTAGQSSSGEDLLGATELTATEPATHPVLVRRGLLENFQIADDLPSEEADVTSTARVRGSKIGPVVFQVGGCDRFLRHY